jgi:hypothetical protein
MNPTLLRPLPETSLLAAYEGNGGHTDCYTLDVAGKISHAQFVKAFYTSRLFKVERLILKWLVAKPSTDQQVEQLVVGSRDEFAAWHVEKRSPDQLLLCDFQGRTRSWLMVAPIEVDAAASTRLSFGSAVLPVKNRKTGALVMPLAFKLLLGFHRLYAKALLRSAARRLGQLS